MKKFIVLGLLLVLIGSLIAWRVVQKRTDAQSMERQRVTRASAPPKVSVARSEIRNIINTFDATGSLEAPMNVKISPKVSGRINYLAVHEGDAVHKGQVLVRIDAADVEAQVHQQEASLAEARYRLAQALITTTSTDAGVRTQIRQQVAAVAGAQADYNQVVQNLRSQIASAEAGVTDVQGRIDSANATISNAKAAINSAQANLNNATIRRDRVLELYKGGFIAAQEVDDAKATVSVQQAALEVTQGQLRSAQSSRDSALAQRQVAEQQVKIVRTKGNADVEAAHQKLAQAKASLDYARANAVQSPAYRQGIAALQASVAAAQASVASARAKRADTVLTCPLEGYVTTRYVDQGSMASAAQPILAVQFFKQVWVSVAAPDDVSARLHIGQPTTVWFDALPGRTFTASIVQINPSADPQARQFTVRAIMSNDQGLFKPGMFAHVSIVTQKAYGVVCVPREAVQTGEAGSTVTTVDAQSIAHIRPVTVGLADAKYISLTQGLQAGETVVVMSGVPVKEGKEVKVPTAGGSKGGAGQGARGRGPAVPAAQPGAPAPAR